ncbi:MAG: hypothetical protein ABJN14_10705 [Paracoccaceae bacterium]
MIGIQFTKHPFAKGLGIIAGAALIGFGVLQFAGTNGLGFPDGHISDVDRVLIPYDYAVAIWTVLLGISAFVLAVGNPKKGILKTWSVAFLFAAAALLVRPIYAAYLATFLAASAGG